MQFASCAYEKLIQAFGSRLGQLDYEPTMGPAQQLKLWELAGDNPNLSFSPFVWRVRLALAYKGLPYEYKPWRFSDKELIKPCKTVTCLDFDGKKCLISFVVILENNTFSNSMFIVSVTVMLTPRLCLVRCLPWTMVTKG